MGAWIETVSALIVTKASVVAPFMGAWIETPQSRAGPIGYQVAPFMGAWIETLSVDVGLSQHWSHPSWVRGLKHLNLGQDQLDTSVAPFMGAWIETNSRR